MNMFPEQGERAKALGIYGFVCSGGGSIGVLLGGFLTSRLTWHWIFLVNLPIGIVVYLLCLYLIPASAVERGRVRLDITGAVIVTTALMLAVYTIINGNEAGWTFWQFAGLLATSAALLGAFLVTETRVSTPLVPLGLFRSRAVSVSNIVAVLWAVAIFAWFFLAALYLQRVLGYNPMQVGLAFLPANLATTVLSLGLSARLVTRFGIKTPMALGMLLAASGLALFASAPEETTSIYEIYPAMILLGTGVAIAFNPLLMAAMSGVAPSESGLASGLVNTSFMMGGSVGLAVLASAASIRTTKLLTEGATQRVALNGGYHFAFALGALTCVVAAVLGAALLPSNRSAADQPKPPTAARQAANP
jgi:MFS family permease